LDSDTDNASKYASDKKILLLPTTCSQSFVGMSLVVLKNVKGWDFFCRVIFFGAVKLRIFDGLLYSNDRINPTVFSYL
jgi:hypothetical protein